MPRHYEDPVIFQATSEWCDTWTITLPEYNANFVTMFKKRIPPDYRSWDPQEKQWSVSEKYLAVAEELVAEHFPGAEIERAEP